jgi:3-oxoacyl-[acyl-carrier protein] reductase
MNEQWDDVKVLVTGGSQGIGLGLAASFIQAGAWVCIAGRDQARLTAAQSELVGGHPVATVVADVSRPEDCAAMTAETADRLGGIDVLCANAGIYPEQSIGELTDVGVGLILDVNLKGTMFAVQACVPFLKRSGRGRVVVTSSITGPTTGYPGLSAYAASKAGQLGFVRTAALELATHGITVNAILPGSIRTPSLEGLGAEAIELMKRSIPIGRLGEPSDIGAAALFMAGANAGFITGQAMVVDGGQTLPELPIG